MLDQCCACVADGGPTLIKHWVNYTVVAVKPQEALNKRWFNMVSKYDENILNQRGPISRYYAK